MFSLSLYRDNENICGNKRAKSAVTVVRVGEPVNHGLKVVNIFTPSKGFSTGHTFHQIPIASSAP